ncbi:MAG: twin transmembrane helix small protein [Gammaproteobacteria bacterium]|nr:MAG: twin transmembrane helix small protein [Gammaproteobacteria bacterium]
MFIKLLMFLTFMVIIASLFRGLFTLVKDQGRSKRTVNALTVRVVASAIFIILIVIGIKTGALKPHGVMGLKPAASQVDNERKGANQP